MFQPPVALASLSGRSNATWARAVGDHVGAAFLGGIALDEPTREAARAMVERDREEFLPPDPIAFVDRELAELARVCGPLDSVDPVDSADSVDSADRPDSQLRPAFNVRSVTVDPVRDAAQVCRTHDAILEINAHCRQSEMCAVGAGEALLRDTDRLCDQVAAAAEEGAAVSVKVRTEVDGVALPETVRRVVSAGADAVHVDAMDSEAVVARVARTVESAGGGFVIANNGVRDLSTAREYLAYGADALSVGRASDDPRVLDRVRRATRAWFGHQERRVDP